MALQSHKKANTKRGLQARVAAIQRTRSGGSVGLQPHENKQERRGLQARALRVLNDPNHCLLPDSREAVEARGFSPTKKQHEERSLDSGSLGKFRSRFISPDGLAGGRGDLTLDGNHWTYLDKPPPTLKGNWSRVENFILDHDHIRFEECESADEGKTWTKTNSGTEERTAG